MYKINHKREIVRLSDNRIIPKDVNHFLYQEYLTWINEGNKPEPPVSDPNSVMKVYQSLKRDGLHEEAAEYLKSFKR